MSNKSTQSCIFNPYRALSLLALALFVKDVPRRLQTERPKFGLPTSPAYRRFIVAILIFSLATRPMHFCFGVLAKSESRWPWRQCLWQGLLQRCI
jgi:hypothetical protein